MVIRGIPSFVVDCCVSVYNCRILTHTHRSREKRGAVAGVFERAVFDFGRSVGLIQRFLAEMSRREKKRGALAGVFERTVVFDLGRSVGLIQKVSYDVQQIRVLNAEMLADGQSIYAAHISALQVKATFQMFPACDS